MIAAEKELPLAEKRRFDHTVFVYREGDAVQVKLLDDSREGTFVDATDCIQESRETVGRYLVPFVDGTVTVSSAEEVAFIMRHLPMTVERRDVERSTAKLTKFYELAPSLFPESDAHLVGLLKGTPIDAGFANEPWAPILRQAIDEARENDMFAKTPEDSLFAV